MQQRHNKRHKDHRSPRDDAKRVGASVTHVKWVVQPDLTHLPANILDKGSDFQARPGYGVRGAQSAPASDKKPQDIPVVKNRLTGFRDNNALDQILQRLNVTRFFYTGVKLDRCVFAPLAEGCFDAVFDEDAATTVSPRHVSDAIRYLIRLLSGFTAMLNDIPAAIPPKQPTGVQ
ncbi:MAG: isochorismatase family protein [Roseobacter sp.]